jgi:hypothetical protein
MVNRISGDIEQGDGCALGRHVWRRRFIEVSCVTRVACGDVGRIVGDAVGDPWQWAVTTEGYV